MCSVVNTVPVKGSKAADHEQRMRLRTNEKSAVAFQISSIPGMLSICLKTLFVGNQIER